MIECKAALGFKESSCYGSPLNFDRFRLKSFPGECSISSEMLLEWLEPRPREGVNGAAARSYSAAGLANCINAMGGTSHVLHAGYLGKRARCNPYMYSDMELKLFIFATDLHAHAKNPLDTTVRDIFRLQRSCGLRPFEPRLLKRGDVDFEGETIYIADSRMHNAGFHEKPGILFMCVLRKKY
ncbi:MAG: hypothetical protein LBU32_05960 [Clostridiales bacterium]|jgi:integrase|nr:hypothetical protein [Clostridiales bacterium]